MKLSLLDRKLIATLCLSGDIPLSELASRIKEPPHRARYAFSRLLSEKVLTPYLYINPSALGLTEYAIHLSLLTHGAGARKDFEQRIMKAKRVSWFATTGTAWEYAIVLATRKVHDVSLFLSELNAGSKLSYRKIISTQLKITIYSPKGLGVELPAALQHVAEPLKQVLETDSIDRTILAILAKDPLASTRQVAQTLGMTPAALSYRLKKLSDAGALRGSGFLINARSFGCIAYRFIIECRNTNEKIKVGFSNFCLKHKNVIVLIENLGAWDFQIGAHFSSEDDVPNFIDELYRNFQDDISAVTPIQLHEIVKRNSYPMDIEVPLRPSSQIE